MARIVEIHPASPQQRLLDTVTHSIRQGALVAYPTDSGYALGCAMDNHEARQRIIALRQLPDDHHFTLVCKDFAQLGSLAHLDNSVFRAIKASTPGPFTFILPATKEVPRRLQHPKKKTVGVRFPQHRLTLAVVADLGEPLVSSSLVLPDQDEPLTQAWQIDEVWGSAIDLIIDTGDRDPDVGSEPTTVIDLSGVEPVIIRQGAGDPTLFR